MLYRQQRIALRVLFLQPPRFPNHLLEELRPHLCALLLLEEAAPGWPHLNVEGQVYRDLLSVLLERELPVSLREQEGLQLRNSVLWQVISLS